MYHFWVRQIIMTVEVKKWGNSFALRIPAAVANALNIWEGEPMEMSVAESSVTFGKTDVLSSYLAGWRSAAPEQDHWALHATREFEEVISEHSITR